MLKILLTLLLIAAAVFLFFLFYQGRVSASIPSPSLEDDGSLPACPDKPNCVSSAADPSNETHYIAPLAIPGVNMEALKTAVEQDGGTDVTINGNQLTATYTSRLFKFSDDLLFINTPTQIEVRSSSRVGYSDLDANRKRVERLREKISR